MATITKLALTQINARLAAENLELRTKLSVADAEITRLKAEVDEVDEILKDRLADPEDSLNKPKPAYMQAEDIKAFCRLYCEAKGTRSVPGHVVKTWRAAQSAQS